MKDPQTACFVLIFTMTRSLKLMNDPDRYCRVSNDPTYDESDYFEGEGAYKPLVPDYSYGEPEDHFGTHEGNTDPCIKAFFDRYVDNYTKRAKAGQLNPNLKLGELDLNILKTEKDNES